MFILFVVVCFVFVVLFLFFVGCFSFVGSGFVDIGEVFYYGSCYVGLCIVSGECYNFNVMIVVYCMLLFGICVWVINFDNCCSVVVWINDCGLFCCGWIIDVLCKVVEGLGMICSGVVLVWIELLD